MHLKQEFKTDPTLYEMNGPDLVDEEIKRPTSLAFTDAVNAVHSNNYSNISNSALSITTPSSLIVGSGFSYCLCEGNEWLKGMI